MSHVSSLFLYSAFLFLEGLSFHGSFKKLLSMVGCELPGSLLPSPGDSWGVVGTRATPGHELTNGSRPDSYKTFQAFGS